MKNHIIKKLLQKKFLLLVCTLLTSNLSFATTIKTVGGVRYEIDNGEATIVSYTSNLPANLNIPESISYRTVPYKVTKLADECFSDAPIQSVTLPENVTSIGAWSFSDCTQLKSVSLPSNITKIGESCFCGCTSLAALSIPNSVNTIGEWCFFGCDSLTSVSLSTALTALPDYCFCNCPALNNMTIPEGVDSIGYLCFDGCSSLKSVTIPQTVMFVGGYAFSQTPWFDNCSNGPVYINNVLYSYKGDMPETTTIDVRKGTTSLSEYAFEGYLNLKSIAIPNNITEIGKNCFDGCEKLSSVRCRWRNPIAVNDSVFTGVPIENDTLYVPTGTSALYAALSPWNKFGVMEEYVDTKILENLEDDIHIEVAGSTIYIHGLSDNERISIFTVGGQLVGEVTASGNDVQFDVLERNQVMIVKTSKRTFKVRI